MNIRKPTVRMHQYGVSLYMAGALINNSPTPTDLNKNPRAKTNFVFGVSQKSATVVLNGIALELEPPRPIFEKIFSSSFGVLGGY